MKYFVVAIGGSNLPLPIVNEDDEIELFNTYTQAEEMAEHRGCSPCESAMRRAVAHREATRGV